MFPSSPGLTTGLAAVLATVLHVQLSELDTIEPGFVASNALSSGGRLIVVLIDGCVMVCPQRLDGFDAEMDRFHP